MTVRALAAALLVIAAPAAAQDEVFRVTFDADPTGAAPVAVPGLAGLRPTGLFGEAEARVRVEPLFGDVGASTASGNVAVADVPTAGDFHLLSFDATLVAGVVTSGTVRIGFDLLMDGAVPGDGFAFLRATDETEEDVGSVILNVDASSVSIGLLDYDPATGEFEGVVYPDDASYAAGTWHRIDLTYDLDANTVRLAIDGQDRGIEGGLNRATGAGIAAAFFNWGTAYVGRSAIDNVTMEVPETTGLPPAPAGFTALLEPDTPGTVLRPPDGDLRQRGVAFDNSSAVPLVWAPVYDGVATYRLEPAGDAIDDADTRPRFVRTVPIRPNRTYEVSALIRADFPRADWEFSVLLWGTETADPPPDENLNGGRYGGMPAVTDGPDGWQRWTWRLTPHWPTATHLRVAFGIHEYGFGFDASNVSFELADLAVVERPREDLVPFPPGEGVTFAGGPGALDMRIDGVTDSGDRLTVRTLGAAFVFDRARGTLALGQRLTVERDLAVVRNLDLSGLSVQSKTEDAVVLVGDALTIGVQADGAVVLSPHTNLLASVESRIGGDFNRIARGDVFSMDDWGGFTANVHVPLGTGRQPRLAPVGSLPFEAIAPDDLDTPGAAAPGWRVRARVAPGERLFLSAFPGRPYDWEASFTFAWSLAGFGEPPGSIIKADFTSDWLLWNVSERAWGMSFGPEYVPRTDIAYTDYVPIVEGVGDRWLAYFSQWFYFSRDAQTFADEVARWRDEYGMEGMYSDGLAQDDWLSAYEAARRLRGDVFPDGTVILHDSFPQSGVAGAAFRPFIYTYATATYMAESAASDAGADWSWARYVTGQYGRANAIGVTKGDGWIGFEGVEKYLVGLVWGGRGTPQTEGFETAYLPILRELDVLWREYGDDPNFFDRVYHPEAQRLTGYAIGRAGMPSVTRTGRLHNEEVVLSSWTEGAEIRYTLDGSVPDETAALYTEPLLVPETTTVTARAFRADLGPSLWATGSGSPRLAAPSASAAAGPVLLASPNPVRGRLALTVTLAEAGAVRLDVIDALGRVVATLADGETGAGVEALSLDTATLAPGVYTARLSADGAVQSVRFTVVR